MDQVLPNRQSIRKKGWDYTASGDYFVTINTHASRTLFGAIVNGRMVLNEVGQVAEEEWRKSAVIRDGIELDEFVVMPNHVHGIVRLKPSQGRQRALLFDSGAVTRERPAAEGGWIVEIEMIEQDFHRFLKREKLPLGILEKLQEIDSADAVQQR